MKTTKPSLRGIDRREHQRVRYHAEVEIEWGSSTVCGRTGDISLGGMLVEMENPLWVGATFRASLSSIDGPLLAVDCVVRRVLPSLGMGVEFTDLRGADQQRLRALVERLPH